MNLRIFPLKTDINLEGTPIPVLDRFFSFDVPLNAPFRLDMRYIE